MVIVNSLSDLYLVNIFELKEDKHHHIGLSHNIRMIWAFQLIVTLLWRYRSNKWYVCMYTFPSTTNYLGGRTIVRYWVYNNCQFNWISLSIRHLNHVTEMKQRMENVADTIVYCDEINCINLVSPPIYQMRIIRYVYNHYSNQLSQRNFRKRLAPVGLKKLNTVKPLETDTSLRQILHRSLQNLD